MYTLSLPLVQKVGLVNPNVHGNPSSACSSWLVLAS